MEGGSYEIERDIIAASCNRKQDKNSSKYMSILKNWREMHDLVEVVIQQMNDIFFTKLD